MIEMMFQGGFVGIECDIILTGLDDQVHESNRVIHTIFPDDVNNLQKFSLPNPLEIPLAKKLELKFKQSSDFYGRVTLYIVHFEGIHLDSKLEN